MADVQNRTIRRSRIPFRRKMDLLVLLPLVAMIGLLAPLTVQQSRSARGWSDAADYLSGTKEISVLVQDLSQERVQAQAALYDGASQGAATQYRIYITTTDKQVATVLKDLRGSGTPAMMAALNSVSDLSYVRGQIASISKQGPTAVADAQKLVDKDYGKVVSDLVNALDLVGRAAEGDPAATLENQLAALYQGDLSENQREAALTAFAGSADSNSAIETYTTALQQEQVANQQFAYVLSYPQLGDNGELSQVLHSVQMGWFEDYQGRIATALKPAFSYDAAGRPISVDQDLKALRTASYRQFTTQYFEDLSRQRAVTEADVTDWVISKAHKSADRAQWIAIGLIGGAFLVLIILIVLSTAIRRSVVRPVLQLTTAASRVARAAAADLERVSDEDAGQNSPLPEFTPLPVTQSDEIGDLARAFNQVQETALLVLERQVTIRRNTAEMFGNVGRRIHNLTGRQLSIIDQVERTETDPVLLDRMYRIDHLAVRLQRGADSLILLSGEREANISGAPMRLTDVVRSAVGRVEGYQRVVLIAEDDAMVAPAAVSDLTLMIAELVENAVSFSPASSRVEIAVGLTPRGFVVEIVDRGMGMTPEHLAAENARLVRRERLDLAPTRVLGLFVVGRLSVRTGAAVELAPTPGGGTTARIFVPGFLLAGPSTEALPQRTPAAEIAAAQLAAADGFRPDQPHGPDNAPVPTAPFAGRPQGAPADGDGGPFGTGFATGFGPDSAAPPRPGQPADGSEPFGVPAAGGGRRRGAPAADAHIPRQPGGEERGGAGAGGGVRSDGLPQRRPRESGTARPAGFDPPFDPAYGFGAGPVNGFGTAPDAAGSGFGPADGSVPGAGFGHGRNPGPDSGAIPGSIVEPGDRTGAGGGIGGPLTPAGPPVGVPLPPPIGEPIGFGPGDPARPPGLPARTGPQPQEAYPVYSPQDPPTMITSPLPPVEPGRPQSVSAITPQAADAALPRRVRTSAPPPAWPPAGVPAAADAPPPMQDAQAVREALEEYEAGVEQALRDSAVDELPTRRRSGRHAGPATPGTDDAVPEDTRRTTP